MYSELISERDNRRLGRNVRHNQSVHQGASVMARQQTLNNMGKEARANDKFKNFCLFVCLLFLFYLKEEALSGEV